MVWIEGNILKRLDKGRYLSLDRPSNLVRSTISISFSHDGQYFASTHGDHTVKVFVYPSGEQIACLEGHPRTPWTVRFHPKNANILASGCLGNECRVWDISTAECIRKHTCKSSISCVSFSPDGTLLAITSGKQLLLWEYTVETRNGSRLTSSVFDGSHGPGLPREILEKEQPFHMVDFHPSGTMLMTGEKNPASNQPNGNHQHDEQFTLKLIIHRFDRRMEKNSAEPILIVPRAVAYNDAGIHFSPCGTMLAACIPDLRDDSNSFNLSVMSLVNKGDTAIGSLLCYTPLDRAHVTALTNLKFSATSEHVLAGFSFKPDNPILRAHAERYNIAMTSGVATDEEDLDLPLPKVRVVDIYRIGSQFERIRSLKADMNLVHGRNRGAEDEINVAVFAPTMGVADAVIYGTQKGRIRLFQQATGNATEVLDICNDEVPDYSDSSSTWSSQENTTPPAARSSSVSNHETQTGEDDGHGFPTVHHNSV